MQTQKEQIKGIENNLKKGLQISVITNLKENEQWIKKLNRIGKNGYGSKEYWEHFKKKPKTLEY